MERIKLEGSGEKVFLKIRISKDKKERFKSAVDNMSDYLLKCIDEAIKTK